MEPILVEQLPASRRSLRLAVVTETYPPEVNGVAISLSRFVEGLRERNHEIQLIRPRQALLDQPVKRERFDEMLTFGMPIPRYPRSENGFAGQTGTDQTMDIEAPGSGFISSPKARSAGRRCRRRSN
jgi:hypothetical protein